MLEHGKKGVDVEMVITNSVEGERTIAACVRSGTRLEGARLKGSSQEDAVKFITMLWNACKDDENYTLVNMTRIAYNTARFFPDVARTRKVVDTIEDTLHLDEEVMAAYLTTTKSVRHKTNFAVTLASESTSYQTKRRPAMTGSLALH